MILGVSEAPETISFAAMSERQQALVRVILKDPDVASLSSFIGIDGTNMTPNSGRIQINLKPRDERHADATEIIRPPPAGAPERRGHHALHAAGAGPDRGEPGQPDAVPVHARGRGREGAGGVDAPAHREAQGAAGAARRGQRPAERRAAGHARHRSRHRVAAGHRAAAHRRHAVRRLRPAPGLDHLHAS